MKYLFVLLAMLTFFICVLVYLAYVHLPGKKYAGSKAAHIREGAFYIDGISSNNKTLRDVAKWGMSESNDVPWDEPYTTDTIPYTPLPPDTNVRATFINHATVLVETPTLALLTDPIFATRASPFSFAGPARHHDPYIPLASIPRVDVVIISHNHYDHLSIETLEEIEARFAPLYIVPLNNAQFVARAGVPRERIVELDLYETHTVQGARITLEVAQHWTARSVGDRNRYLWGSYMVEMPTGERVYFAGDTGYGPHFSALLAKYGRIDMALLPIGAYEPRWFMQQQHMNPTDAVQAATDLGSPQVMGIHFGTFKLTNEGRHDPEKHTKEAVAQQKYPNIFLAPTIPNGLVLTLQKK